MSPQLLRAYVLILTRDIIPPVTGTFLAIYLPTHGLFAYWQLPLIAGCFGIPLVGHGGDPPPPPPEEPEP